MYARELKAEEAKIFFDLSAERGNIFTNSKWTSIYGANLILLGLFKKKTDQLLGGFCLYRERKFGISYLRTPPFTPHISIFYVIPSTNPANVNSTRKKVIQAVTDFVKENNLALINLSFPPDEQDMQPIIWGKLEIKVRYTYQVALAQDEKKILSNFSPERRNDLTKAAKDGVIVKRAEDFKEIKILIDKTYKENGLRVYPKILEKIFNEFADSENSVGFLSYRNGIPIACTFVVFNNRVAYYILGGYDRENRHHGAGALCIWESIKEAKKRGVNIFDFEGSMVPSIEIFFRGFGGSIVPFFQVKRLPLFNLTF